MQIIFLHHSSFLVEIDKKVLIFDYFNGDKVDGFTFTGKIPTYAPDTPIYMFASHCHRDHYDLDILRMADTYTNIHYIFSKDIRVSPNFLSKHGFDPAIREKITFVGPGKKYMVDDLNITTFASTDAGVAYYVDINGASFFHAGDLNDWRYEGAGDLINGKTQKTYRHEIKKLAKNPINIAFVPLDPRLGEHKFLGIDYFLRNTDAEFIFPMHMWQDYSSIAEYKKRVSNLGMANRIMDIERENQVFAFGD